MLLPASGAGTSSNEYGFYSLTVPAGDSVEVSFSFVGFQSLVKRLLLRSDLRLDIDLTPGVELEAVDVVADGFKEVFESTQMSTEVLSAKEVKMIPVLLGETDILKAKARYSLGRRRGFRYFCAGRRQRPEPHCSG